MIKKNVKPAYWDYALDHLSSKDIILSNIIEKHSSATHLIRANSAFKTFFTIIIGQQISIEAANSIEEKIKQQLTSITPKNILDKSNQSLRQCGLSFRKIEYIKGIAKLINQNPKYFSNINQMDDDSAVKNLTSLYGIGPWSAEMFLIFHYNRQNILPISDIGLINSFCKNYKTNRKSFHDEVAKYKEIWNPYCTVATWYLWRDIDEDVVQY
tara:strand:+ start:795 stop:1430 length:636 start_codon:yes stop_codon:yes gene_type:complete